VSGWLEVSSVEMPASNQAVTPASIVGLWPAAEAAAPCGDFRLRMKCGLDLLTESLSHFDPLQT
jgi:hypothetical protein